MCYNQLMENTQLIIMALVGLAVLLFGYRIKKVGFFIAWFILGYNLLTLFLPTLNDLVPQIKDSSLWQMLIPIAGGLLMGLLGFTIEKFCVAGIVFVAVMAITVQYFGTELLTLAIGAIVAVFAAALAVRMIKPAIIIATAAVGAYAVTVAILGIWPAINGNVFYWPILCGLILVGALFQFSSTKKIS